MIRTLPNTKTYRRGYNCFIIFYFFLLFAPLLVISILAFNNSKFPSLPWRGFTLDWFFGKSFDMTGIFHDSRNLGGIFVSVKVACWVTLFSTVVGTCAAFLFEHEEFRFKSFFYSVMIAPLVVPGVIIGISILSFATSVGTFLERSVGIDLEILKSRTVSGCLWAVLLYYHICGTSCYC